MILLTRHYGDRYDIPPGHWIPVTLDGRKTAIVACALCGQHAYLCHEIAADGTLSPSLVCPADGCAWHVFAKLDGWIDAAAKGGPT